MFLVHHNNLSDVVTYYEEGLNLSKRVSSFLELFKLVILLFYILHIFTCLWVWVFIIFDKFRLGFTVWKFMETVGWHDQT